jgi:hypothetical protein
MVPVKKNRNIFEIGLGLLPIARPLGPQRLANLYENVKCFERKIIKIVFVSNCLIFLR